MKQHKLITWICRIISAGIMLQTLYFKFSGAEESVYIFSEIGMEPWGRYVTGVAELAASILILIPRVSVPGALLAIGIMAGAILTHLFIIGVVVANDGGLLFFYACCVFLTSSFVLYSARDSAITVLRKFRAVV